jgi:hypothetical protein
MSFLELVDDGTAKTALHTFQMQFGNFCSLRCSDTASIIHHNTNMPMGVVTAAFVGAYPPTSMTPMESSVRTFQYSLSYLLKRNPSDTSTSGVKQTLHMVSKW